MGGARKLGVTCSCKTRGGARRLVEKLGVPMVSQGLGLGVAVVRQGLGLGLEGWEWQW